MEIFLFTFYPHLFIKNENWLEAINDDVDSIINKTAVQHRENIYWSLLITYNAKHMMSMRPWETVSI